MALYTSRTGTTSPEQELAARVSKLEEQLKQWQRCVQLDGTGTSLSLKAPLTVTIDAAGKVNLTAGTALKLSGSIISLNP